MAADFDAIIVGQTGKVWTAPLATVSPVTSVAVWAAGWVDLGTIAEDGVSVAQNEDTAELKQWGGGVVRKLFTSSELTFKFICLESNPEVIARYYKQPITAGAVELKAGVSDERKWGIDVLDGDTHVRYVINRGEVTEKGDITYKADQAAQYEFTVSAYQDGDGVAAIMYSDAAAWDEA